MSKIALPFVLILILVGIGYFLGGGADCDGKVVFADSGPDIPPGDGLNWLDLGNGWIGLDNNPEVDRAAYTISGWLGYDVICYIDEIDNYQFLNLVGDTVRYGLRFDPMTTQSQQKADLREMCQSTMVYPLIEERGFRGDLYVLDQQNAAGLAARSDLREDREYIYLVFNDIPPSPTGMYAFVMVTTHAILLQKN